MARRRGFSPCFPTDCRPLIAPTILLIGKSVANPEGIRLLAVSALLCFAVTFVLLHFFYNENKLQASLKAHGYQ